MNTELINLIYGTNKSLLSSKFQKYAEAKGNAASIVPFIATVSGLKNAMDDWVQVSRLDAYLEMCREFGLYYKINCFFVSLRSEELTYISGGEKLTTTKASAIEPGNRPEQGEAHLFLSMSPDKLEEAYKNGWYYLAVNGRVIEKPYPDHIKFGQALSYPNCCLDFFLSNNNWFTTNFYAEIKGNSKRYLALCNTFAKHTPFSFASHMPCSFDCQETLNYARKAQKLVAKNEPLLADKIKQLTRFPLLALSEIHQYILEGRVVGDGNQLLYNDFAPLPPTPRDNSLAKLLELGDEIRLKGNIIKVFKKKNYLGCYQARNDQVGPEIPLIFHWSE